MNETTVKTRPATAAGQTFRGVLSPALTPFTADLEPDRPAFVGFFASLIVKPGPTTPVSPAEMTRSVGSTNDLKPLSRSLVNRTACLAARLFEA